MLIPGNHPVDLVQVHELWPDGDIRFTSPIWRPTSMTLDIITDNPESGPGPGALFHIGLVDVPEEMDEIFTRASEGTSFAVQLWQRHTEEQVRQVLDEDTRQKCECSCQFPVGLTYVLPHLTHLYTTALHTWRAVPVPNPALMLPGVPPLGQDWRGGVLALDTWPEFAPASGH